MTDTQADLTQRARADYMQQALEIIHASNEWSGTPPPVPYREHLQRGIAAALQSEREAAAAEKENETELLTEAIKSTTLKTAVRNLRILGCAPKVALILGRAIYDKKGEREAAVAEARRAALEAVDAEPEPTVAELLAAKPAMTLRDAEAMNALAVAVTRATKKAIAERIRALASSAPQEARDEN